MKLIDFTTEKTQLDYLKNAVRLKVQMAGIVKGNVAILKTGEHYLIYQVNISIFDDPVIIMTGREYVRGELQFDIDDIDIDEVAQIKLMPKKD